MALQLQEKHLPETGPNDRRNHWPQELERRIATLESEVLGEKAMTRHVLQQSMRNGDLLLALRAEVGSMRVDLSTLASRADHIASDVVLASAALNRHGTRLNVLTQDVREIRTRLDAWKQSSTPS